jgi:hypothetical protein
MPSFKLLLLVLVHVLINAGCTKNTLRKRIAEIQSDVNDASKARRKDSLRSISSDSTTGSSAKSPLTDWLQSLHRQGVLSTQQLQKGATAACSTFGDAAETLLRDLAGMGTGGTQGSNVLRDFQRQMKKWTHMPELYQATVPLWDKHTNSQIFGNLFFLLPHELLPLLVRGNLNAWTSFDESVRELQHVVANWREKNLVADDTNNLVAMSVWGDSAPYNTRDSLILFLWSALSGDNQDRFWITAFPKQSMCNCGCHGRHTFDGVWRVLSWSFKALLSGKYPEKRHDETPFGKLVGDRNRAKQAGKDLNVRGCCIQSRGDWSWHKQCADLQDWVQSSVKPKAVCWLCQANNHDLPYWDASKEAKWRFRPRTTHATFIASRLATNSYISGIFSIPGFVLDYFGVDFMHVADLGVTQYFLGAVLFTLFLEMGGVISRPGEACGKLMTLIKMFARKVGIDAPINTLTLTMFRASASAGCKFKGKASECRYLVPIVLLILRIAFPAETDVAKLRLECAEQLAAMYRAVLDWDATTKVKASDAARKFVIKYCELQQYYNNNLIFKIVPKFHMLIHCIERLRTEGSIKRSWCYADEQAIGKAVEIAAKGHPKTICRTVMEKYRNWDMLSH